jgi:hypothetical protein
MKVNKKHFGLMLASLIALSFNSHFAQAAKKTTEVFTPTKAYAFKKVGDNQYTPLPEITPENVVVKKTGVKIDRTNVYIGGYLVNTTNKTIPHIRIFPSFTDGRFSTSKFVDALTHDELDLAPKEIRRFVIMRPAAQLAPLLSTTIPFNDNCILYCREING